MALYVYILLIEASEDKLNILLCKWFIPVFNHEAVWDCSPGCILNYKQICSLGRVKFYIRFINGGLKLPSFYGGFFTALFSVSFSVEDESYAMSRLFTFTKMKMYFREAWDWVLYVVSKVIMCEIIFICVHLQIPLQLLTRSCEEDYMLKVAEVYSRFC